MSAQATELVTKQEALETVTRFIDKSGTLDLPVLMELISWQNKLILWVLQERTQKEAEELCTAKTVPEIAQLVARLLKTCGIYNYQQVGYELARMGVTTGLGRE